MASNEVLASAKSHQRDEQTDKAGLTELPPAKLRALLNEFATTNDEIADRLDAELTRLAKEQLIPPAPDTDPNNDEPYMVGSSATMLHSYDRIRRFAKTEASVLITGESGTGKELAALAIHERSNRSSGPFAAINCAGLPTTLITSELFGYEKGAFTGANQRHIGRIEAANGGTVFLDEIGDLPLELQPHLLRFLQEQTIERLGSTRLIKVNVRIIAATNQNLKHEIENGRFREDLFFRLKVLTLHMPPLRERNEDIALLASFFLKKFQKEMQITGTDFTFSEDGLAALSKYDWPGNVRELISRVREAVIMSDRPIISAADLNLPAQPEPAVSTGPETATGTPPDTSAPDAHQTLEEARARMEIGLIQTALARNNHNVSRTASELGVSRVTLYRLMEKHGMRSDTP